MKKLSFVFSFFLLTLSAIPLFAQTYSKGERVEAFWQGSWYKSNVLEVVKPGFYRIHFDGYWASRAEVLPQDLVRPLPQRSQPDLNTLKSGDKIEFMEGDHWKPAVFVEFQGKKALVRYADGEKHKDKLIKASHMSIPGTPSSLPSK